MDRGRPENPLECAASGELYQGSTIRQMRQAKKLGLRQLAALIPYDAGLLSKVENNRAKVPSDTLEKIAKILEVDAHELAEMPLHPRLTKQYTAPPGAPAQQPPTVAGMEASVLQQILAMLQALMGAVTQLAATVGQFSAAIAHLQAQLAAQQQQNTAIPAYVSQNDSEKKDSQPPVEQGHGKAPASFVRKPLEVELDDHLTLVENMRGEVIRDWEG